MNPTAAANSASDALKSAIRGLAELDPEKEYPKLDQFCDALAENLLKAALQHIIDNAELVRAKTATGETGTGTATVSGGSADVPALEIPELEVTGGIV